MFRGTPTWSVITGNPRREEIPDYPEPALREAIVNAVCHRDYFIREVPVVVEVFADRVEIRNPGGLPKGLDPKKFGIQSFPRNPFIASMLHRVNYIEKAGTGINRMKTTIKNHKRKLSMSIQYGVDNLFYSIIFRKKEPTKATQKTIQKAAQKTAQKATQKTAQKILDLIDKNHFITRQELSKEIGNITPDGVKYHLDRLKKQRLLKRIGPDKGGHWKVTRRKHKR